MPEAFQGAFLTHLWTVVNETDAIRRLISQPLRLRLVELLHRKGAALLEG